MKFIFSFFLLLITTFSNAQSDVAAVSKGNEFYRRQQYADAEKAYRDALQKAPQNTTAQYNLANAVYRQKRYAEAHGVLKKLNEESKDKAVKAAALYNNGVVYTREKALDASIDAYKAALRLKPDDQQARENLQKALTEKKKQEQQKKDQEKKRPEKKSSMSQKEADQKLKLLQEKEKRLQERLQKGGDKGNSMPKDW